jgi:hypothetical protein
MVRLPLWFVTVRNRSGQSDEWQSIYGFTSMKRVADFMHARHVRVGQEDNYKLVLAADRDALLIAIAEAHAGGAEIIRIDPDGGESGEHVPLGEFMALAHTLH